MVQRNSLLRRWLCVLFFSLLLAAVDAAADETIQLLVLPFEIHASQDLTYLKEDIPKVIGDHLQMEGAVLVEKDRAAAVLRARTTMSGGTMADSTIQREQWQSRWGFLLAAVGSAVGVTVGVGVGVGRLVSRPLVRAAGLLQAVAAGRAGRRDLTPLVEGELKSENPDLRLAAIEADLAGAYARWEALEGRKGISGIAEKASRKQD